jgi:hypothetical protein
MQHSSSAMTSSDDGDASFQDAFSSEEDVRFPFAIGDDDDGAGGSGEEVAADENNYEPLFPDDDGEIDADNQDGGASYNESVGRSAQSGACVGEKEGTNNSDGHDDALDYAVSTGREFSIGEDEGDDGPPDENSATPPQISTREDPMVSSTALLDDVDLADQNANSPRDPHPNSPTSSGESWEPVEDDGVSMNNAVQYEILPGLFAHLSDDAVVGLHDVESYTQSDVDNNSCQIFDVIVSAQKACLGRGSFLLGGDVTSGDGYVITARNVTIRAQLVKPHDARDDWDVALRDLNISISGGLELDPQADRTQVADFLAKFGFGADANDNVEEETSSQHASSQPQPNIPARRMTKEEWQQFLRNAREDKRANSSMESPKKEAQRDAARIDFLISNAKVFEVSCKVSKEKTINFPACEGTAKCTLRTLLEYYFRSILNTIEQEGRGGGNPELDGKYSVADVTSVKGSLVGAAAGSIVAGPIGFLAGSYLGSQLGRKHSGAVVGATAGCLFGPVGLIAGACIGESRRNLNTGASTRSLSAFGQSTSTEQSTGGLASVAADHVSTNKYEYAGTAGVVAGAAAGSVAGPIGMVAGAYLGSVSARKATENASSAAAEVSERDGRRGYAFGDITRGLVARGKEARGADRQEGYQFGDFSRGLFGGKKN